MKKKYLLLFIGLLIFSALSFAQKSGNKLLLKGIVADSLSAPIEGAAVFLYATDSMPIAMQQTDAKGAFSLSVPMRPYTLKLSFVGFEPYEAAITPPMSGNTLDLGVMRLQAIQLGTVTINADRIAIKVSKDTIEFGASSFKTEANAPAEDLVKKLPGVEVDKDGNVTAQGEQVRKVRVNGKEFFGSDPKLALQNLPADAVQSVQIYDKKSDAAEFSGVEDGQRERTLNLVLRPDRSKGKFGNVTVGAGRDLNEAIAPELRYTARANYNSFGADRQFSFIGLGNNINRQGFTFEDYQSFNSVGSSNNGGGGNRGGMQMRMGGGGNANVPLDFGGAQGFAQTWAAGLNFNRVFSPKTELNIAYFFNASDNLTAKTGIRQNFLDSKIFTTNSKSDNNVANLNHRINWTLDQKIDSVHTLKWTATISQTKNDNNLGAFSENLRSDTLQNNSLRSTNTDGTGLNINTNLLFRKKFKRNGRTLTANASYAYNESFRDIWQETYNNFFVFNRIDTILQSDLRQTNRHTLGGSASYTEPLSRRAFLEFNYSYQNILSDAGRDVFNQNNVGDRIPNTLLTNHFENVFTYQRMGATYRYQQKSYNFSTGLQYQYSLLRGYNATRDTTIKANFGNLLPNIRFQYNPKIGQNFGADYETTVREPSIDQLQPIVDNSDPLNVSIGNPNLSPEFDHSLRLRYNQFNMGTQAGLFSFLRFRLVRDRIVTAQWVDARTLARRYQPINIADGGFDLNAMVNWSFTLDSARKYRLSVGPNMGFFRSNAFVNDVLNVTDRLTSGANIRLDQRRSEKLNFGAGANIRYNLTSYSIQSSQNQTFFNNDIFADFDWKLTKKFTLRSDVNYAFWRGAGLDRDVPIWNASMSYFFLKGNRAELRLLAVDVLNKNVGINRSADVNYFSDERVNSLGRYVMLTFTYAVRPAGQQGDNRMMRMMMR